MFEEMMFEEMMFEEMKELTDTPVGDTYNESREVFVARMIAEGFAIVLPKANELFIDSEQQYAVYLESLAALHRNGIEPVSVHESESRSGYPSRHITITLPFDVEPWQRIAWQAALGSDPMRELLSAIRAYRGDIHPTLFVEAKA